MYSTAFLASSDSSWHPGDYILTQLERAPDDLRAVVLWRVEQWYGTHELPWLAGTLLGLFGVPLLRDAQEAEAAVGVVVYQCVDLLLGVLAHWVQLNDLLEGVLADPAPLVITVDVGDGVLLHELVTFILR